MKNLFWLVLAAGMVLLSCNSKEEETPKPSTTDLLTQNCWVLSAATVDPAIFVNSIFITDLYSVLEICSKDNSLCFSANGRFQVNAIGLKCADTEPAVVSSGSWFLSPDEKILYEIMDGSQDTLVTDILKLEDGMLQTKVFYEDFFGLPRTITNTYRPE